MPKTKIPSHENRVWVYGLSEPAKRKLKNIAAHVGTSESAIIKTQLHLIFAAYPPHFQLPREKD